MMSIRPLHDRILARRVVEQDKTKGGLFMPDNAKQKPLEGAFGYNGATGSYEDLVKAGVIAPTKVVRVALQNAASVASLMLTTEALIAERPKHTSPSDQESS